MSAEQVLAALAETLGPGALEHHDPVSVDGVSVRATLHPRDGRALAQMLAEMGRHGIAGLPRGGGTRLGIGNRPARADVLISTRKLRGVDTFEPAEGVCHAGAGTPLAELRDIVRAQRWELPFDVADAAATLGGALASAAVGPRTQGYGLPRDVVLGLEVVLATGERTRCGGRVVKNVTGYDLGKLYTGCFGTLGVIEGAWLRLRPAPERVALLEAPGAEIAPACEGGLEAARRSSVRACALLCDAGAALRCVVELAGDAASVERDVHWLSDRLRAVPAPADALLRVQRRQCGTQGPHELRFRLGVLPAQLSAATQQLAAEGARILAYPGLNLVYAHFALAEADDLEGAARAFRSAAAVASPGALLCEAAPEAVKRGRDVFSGDPALLPLMRALKQRFDPAAVLNPGRFAGGI